MKRRSAWLSFAACALTAAAPCRAGHTSNTSTTRQAPAPLGFAGVQVITYSNGQTGFFEKETGTLYLYDAALKNCIGVRKISRLGEALENGAETRD